jgi:rsbT antagonist protein RsbS
MEKDIKLQAMEKHEIRGLILDISTVEILYSFSARTITETETMVSLMGGRTVIGGMQGSAAITVTQPGLRLGETQKAPDILYREENADEQQ